MKSLLKFRRNAIAIMVLCLLLYSTVFSAVHSQPSSSTPTLAPTKTATPELQAKEAVTISAPIETSNPLQSFTQADLSTLTGNIQRPNGLVWYNNKIYASCSGDWTVYEIDAITGSTAQYIYGVKNAHSLLATGEGSDLSLWMPDFQSNTVTQITKGISKNIASNLNGPWGIALTANGHFVVSNLHSNNVILIGDSDPLEVIKNLRSPTGISVDGDYLYVANTGSARRAIEWFDLTEVNEGTTGIDATEEETNRSLVSGLQNVTTLVNGSDGFLYFSYALGTRGVVGRVDPSICIGKGGCSNNDVEIVLYSELAAPLAGLTISPDMRLYVHSIFSPDIYWVDLGDAPSSR